MLKRLPDMRWRTADTDPPRPALSTRRWESSCTDSWCTHAYARQATDTHERAWCPLWWRHPEALHRLHTLWRTYEELRTTGPLGVSA